MPEIPCPFILFLFLKLKERNKLSAFQVIRNKLVLEKC